MSGGGDTPTKTLWKIGVGGSYTFGDYSNKILRLDGPDENHYFQASQQGAIQSIDEITEEGIAAAIRTLSQHLGEIESFAVVISSGLNIGDDVPNWDSYMEITI